MRNQASGTRGSPDVNPMASGIASPPGHLRSEKGSRGPFRWKAGRTGGGSSPEPTDTALTNWVSLVLCTLKMKGRLSSTGTSKKGGVTREKGGNRTGRGSPGHATPPNPQIIKLNRPTKETHPSTQNRKDTYCVTESRHELQNL